LLNLDSPPSPKKKLTPRKKVSAKPEPSSSSAVQSDPVAKSPRQSTEKKPTVVAKAALPILSMQTVICSEAELYLWNSEDETFFNQGVVTASIMLRTAAVYDYWLAATGDTGPLLAHKISGDMNQRFSHKMCTLTWNNVGDDGSQTSWLFRFNQDDFGVFLQKFTECMWESLHQTTWAKAKVRVPTSRRDGHKMKFDCLSSPKSRSMSLAQPAKTLRCATYKMKRRRKRKFYPSSTLMKV
jgi:hypothetical protein